MCITAAIIIVFEFPPSESFRSHVSTESRYGMKTFLLFGVRP